MPEEETVRVPRRYLKAWLEALRKAQEDMGPMSDVASEEAVQFAIEDLEHELECE